MRHESAPAASAATATLATILAAVLLLLLLSVETVRPVLLTVSMCVEGFARVFGGSVPCAAVSTSL